MNEFIMLNWHQFDLNYKIINQLKTKKTKKKHRDEIKYRIDKDFRLNIIKE